MEKTGTSILARAHARQQAEAIANQIENLKTMTTAEKITAAYDASVRTHHIGFPKDHIAQMQKLQEGKYDNDDSA
jgi:hypothetical protein